jgi:hypothetical protein
LIIFGAFVAGARDLSFDGYGYAVVFLANITTAIYLATIARIGSIPILTLSVIKWKFYTLFPFKPSLCYLFGFMYFSQEKLAVLIALALCGAMVS